MRLMSPSMTTLQLLVDHDNVQAKYRPAGPVAFAKALVACVPHSVAASYSSFNVRLYGGWRTSGNLTTSAQQLVPIIRANSPTVVLPPSTTTKARLSVELADRPLGGTQILTETFARDRQVRDFRMRTQPWVACASPAACGLNSAVPSNSRTQCASSGCAAKVADVLVRDEQKMVDTLLVADIAACVYEANAQDIVVVSSDVDMWPGVLLALRASRRVTHIHTQPGWRTQGHLMKTLDPRLLARYSQTTI